MDAPHDRFAVTIHNPDSIVGAILEDLDHLDHGTRRIIASATDGDEPQRRALELLARGANHLLNSDLERPTPMTSSKPKSGIRPIRPIGPISIQLDPHESRDLALLAKGANITPEAQIHNYIVAGIQRDIDDALGCFAARRLDRGRGPKLGSFTEASAAPRPHRIHPGDLDAGCQAVLALLSGSAGKEGLTKTELKAKLSHIGPTIIDRAVTKLLYGKSLRREGATIKTRYFLTHN